MKSNYSLLIATLLIFVASNQKQEENKTAESSKNKSAFIFSTWKTSKKDKTDKAESKKDSKKESKETNKKDEANAGGTNIAE